MDEGGFNHCCLPWPPDMHRRNDPPESCKMNLLRCCLLEWNRLSRLLLPPTLLFMMIVVSLPSHHIFHPFVTGERASWRAA
ncbi:hypothetical protein BO85DRAFT_192790 [Aspergillus piperis CBS 112811]|uniref:Uncharacterized protein n=1 Tax=Aspergillus piperis CBS 112811 TaxID=1448313 RepID=A0A8G1R849_9EURO|nr:hypothetical protein BO85DRAFT_192790 [Aspergillus piperis CBS 112811]RAH61284.1 hypothetical protein BO85DRAFT_192790 [Aspergillus piperis CBS 112811]